MEIITNTKPHFVLIPWLGPSHMIPMADIACLLAMHGTAVTVVTTPANAPLFRRCIDRVPPCATTSITLLAVPFPAGEVGLPEGCENMASVTSGDMVQKLYSGAKRLREPVMQHLSRHGGPRPSCVIAGMCQVWAQDMARELGIPCLIFHGYGSFALLCCELLQAHKPHEAAPSADEYFDLPGLPFNCKLTRKQLPMQFQTAAIYDMKREMRDFELAVDGILVNSFDNLEPEYAARLATSTGKKVYTVGPVSLCVEPRVGDEASKDAKKCMSWLGTKKPRSAVYVSFGSGACMTGMQLKQLGLALLSSPWHSIWVIRGADTLPEDVTRWLDETIDRHGHDSKCLVIRGWAPQVAILAHPAVGGFVTHCGWNSTLESVAAGVPVATWPFFAEQFINEKLVVDVLGIGVSIGVEEPTPMEWMLGGTTPKVVGKEEVRKALERLMDGGKEGEERRTRAQEMKDKALEAVEKDGSSYLNMERLIQSVCNQEELEKNWSKAVIP